jgi:hypothetical protein
MLTGDKLAAINSMRVPGPAVDVPRSEIKKVLDGSLEVLQAYAANPPPSATAQTLIAVNYLIAIVGYEASYIPMLQTSNPAYLAAIQSLVPNLLADPAAGVTQNTINQMMALIRPLVPWWQVNGFSAPVNVIDLISAGYLY